MTTMIRLISELEAMVKAFGDAAGDAPEVSLSFVAERIAGNLGVRNEEVAILAVSARRKQLQFLVPEALKNVGFIPLSSSSALAARTARESRPEIDNQFLTARHATVFEGVKIAGETVEAIQKIISAPILAGGEVVGVIQISRKGASATSAGPDFTADDLGKILALCKPLGKMLQHLSGESSDLPL